MIAGYPKSLLNFRRELLVALKRSGLEVHVAAPFEKSDGLILNELRTLGIHPHFVALSRTGINPIKDFRTLLSLWLLMLKIAPEYMLGYTVKPVIYGVIAAWLARVPRRFALITGLGYAFQGENKERWWLKRLAQFLYRFALSKVSKVFFQNPDDKDLFNQLAIAPTKRSVVVNGSGVNTKSFITVPFPEEVNFLLIARLLGDKGVREYISAAKGIKREHNDVNFKLVGWVDDSPDSISENELQTWVDSGVVEYLGRLNDVRPAIADSSVFVLPSYREGTPRTVLEAMAMGRAIITTDTPGCRETVNHGVNGYLVSVRSVDELVEKMLKFINDPVLIKIMGRESRKIAEEKYDVNKVNNFMLSEMGVK